MTDRFANIVIGVVTVGWFINLIASVAQLKGYQSDPFINGVFMGTVGLAFAAKFRKATPRHRGKPDDD